MIERCQPPPYPLTSSPSNLRRALARRCARAPLGAHMAHVHKAAKRLRISNRWLQLCGLDVLEPRAGGYLGQVGAGQGLQEKR
jgi:hypothetical protein